MTVAAGSLPRRSLPYRPDIDGLRAISVLAVILFHAEIPGFAGGYVGVDVFFVISGYLITQVLLLPSERGFAGQLGDFFVRRCRRILPALSVVLLASAVVACWLLLPRDLVRFGRQLGLSAVFVGNWATWRSGGYFDMDAPFAPLVHLWSIAVEEQFYLAFPLVLLAAGRYLRRGRLALLASAALLSFALCVWASYYHPRANFFLAPTRAWEFLLGALVALGIGRSIGAHPFRETFAAAGLLAVVGCIVWYDAGMRYPGLYAVIPCAGAAILLATARSSGSRVSRWISAKPLVFTGLISYSLYLWHVPVLAFAGYYQIRRLEPWYLAILLTLIYGLSAASWRYVEEPARSRRLLPADSRFLMTAGGTTALVALFGLTMWYSQGLPQRLSEADAKLLDYDDELWRPPITCAARSANVVTAGEFCRYGAADGTEDVIVWGDSHTLALMPVYDSIASVRNLRVHAAWLSNCAPLLDAAGDTALPSPPLSCRNFNRAMLSAIDAIDPVLVILHAYWMSPSYEPSPNARGNPHGLPSFELALERTLHALESKRHKVCVVGGVPTLQYVMPHAYAMARRRGIGTEFIPLSRTEALAQHDKLDRSIVQLRNRHGFTFVDPKDALCRATECTVVSSDGRSAYRDRNHLSDIGAHLLGPSLKACFDGIR